MLMALLIALGADLVVMVAAAVLVIGCRRHGKEPPTGMQLVEVIFEIAMHCWPRLAEAAESSEAQR